MDSAALDNLLSGSFDQLMPLPKRVVRLFISSTFTDMTLERNSLMERVYPKLKSYCREQHGLDFQVVDMRWGVRDEATDDHQTVDLCSREIRNCQRMSLGPNFVALIGDKYGFRPLCNRIKSTEYRALRRCLIELDINTDFLDTWYKEDLNAVPAEYLLQPISSILKNYTNKAEPELQSFDQKIWQAIQERIHELLLIGSRKLVAQGRLSEEEQLMRYSISVTEREVIEGCLDVSDAKYRCLVYVRSIKDIKEHLQRCLEDMAAFSANNSSVQQTLAPIPTSSNGNGSGESDLDDTSSDRRRSDSQPRRASLKIGSDSVNLTTSQSQNAAERKVERTRKLLARYIDLIAEDNVWRLDDSAQMSLKALKEKTVASKLRSTSKNWNDFQVNWHEQEGVSLKSEEHKKYLNELTEHFYNNLSSMIRRSAKSNEQRLLRSSGLLGEVLQHSHYARHVSKGFAGRTEELSHLRTYVFGRFEYGQRLLPMFVYGVGGSGKTSFLARSAISLGEWFPQYRPVGDNSSRIPTNQSPCVISRFCGTTPSSSSMIGVLGSICRQLQYNFYQFGSLSSDQTGSDAQLPYGPIPDDFVRLVFSFRQLIENCGHRLHKQRLFVIILDSLERLSPPGEKYRAEEKYSWLTNLSNLPDNVRLIVSFSSESTTIRLKSDFAYLKRYFIRSYFELEREFNISTVQAIEYCEPTKSNDRSSSCLEQKFAKIRPKSDTSESEENPLPLCLKTNSAIRFMQSNQTESPKTNVSSNWSYPYEARKTCWMIHIKPLGLEWSRQVLKNWLQESGRNLTQQQWSIVEKSLVQCSRPIFVKLTFGEVVTWKSYSMQSDTRGLTFGSSLLEKGPTLLESLDDPDQHHLADALAKLTANRRNPVATQQTENLWNDNLLRWQIVCMEQEWLSYLDYKSREADSTIRPNDAKPEAKHHMTIKIDGPTPTGVKTTSASWPTSSSSSSICHLSGNIEDAICQLLVRIEIQHGFLLTKHSLSYLTAARNGICENELEDLLSLDDVVLDDVFQYHLPPVRRIPPLLWARIRSDLPDYLSERDADGTFVVDWHHGQFRAATERRYLSTESAADRRQVVYIHSMMADYFLGKWADKAKPFKCTKHQAQMAAEQLESAIQQSLRDSQSLGRRSSGITGPVTGRLGSSSSIGVGYRGGAVSSGFGSSISVHNRFRGGSNQNDHRFQWMQAKADRRVPHQSLYFDTEDSQDGGKKIRRYNLRKLNELPHHLIRSGRFADLANEVLFNYKWLYCSLDALGLQYVLTDFDDSIKALNGAISKLNSGQSQLDSSYQIVDNDDINAHRGVATIEEETNNVEFLENMLRQIGLLSSAIRLSSSSIGHGRAQMLAPQLIGRLLPVLDSKQGPTNPMTKNLSQLIDQCYREGSQDNCLLPTAHCLQSPEGLQLASLEGHSFAVMAIALTSDQRHLLSVSNKFIMWDISTGEISRVIEPRIDGSMMLSLKLSADNKFALAHTSNNLIILLDILTQQVIICRKLATLLASESITGLELVDKQRASQFIVWTKLRWLLLSITDENHTCRQVQLSIEIEFCVVLGELENLSESTRYLSSLKSVEETDARQKKSNFIVVLGTRLDEIDERFRISTMRVVGETGTWNIKLWSDKIDNVSTFCLNESCSQLIFVDSITNNLYLKRRRRICWSMAKLLYDKIDNRQPVLSLQICSWTPEVVLRAEQDDELLEKLKKFERIIDDIGLSDENTYECSLFHQGEPQKFKKTSGTGMAIVMLHETAVTVIQLGKFNDRRRLALPKDVRNIQVEPNRCQMSALVVLAGSEGRYLTLSIQRKLLFYSLSGDVGQAKLMDSIEAHGARIVQLVPIKSDIDNMDDCSCLIASASIDKSVKVWNLTNLSNNSPSLDKLTSSIESVYLSNETGWAICLSLTECGLFNWRSLKLLKIIQLPDMSRIIKVSMSSNGRYLGLVGLSSTLYLFDLMADAGELQKAKKGSPPSAINHLKLHSFAGSVRKLAFFQQDSRLLATVVSLSREIDEDDEVEADAEGPTLADRNTITSDGCQQVLVYCFSIPDGRLIYTIDNLTPSNLTPRPHQQGQHMSSRGSSRGTTTRPNDVRLPILTRDQAHIVTVELSSSSDYLNKLTTARPSISSSDRSLSQIQLNVYSSRDGKLTYSIGLSQLEVHQAPQFRRDSFSSSAMQSDGHQLGSTKPTSRHQTSNVCRISISANQFTKLKAIPFLDRQSVVALLEKDKRLSFVIDLHSRQLILCSSSWNGKLTHDGRFGLASGFRLPSNGASGLTKSPNGMMLIDTCESLRQTRSDLSSGTNLLQLIEMRQCSPVRNLLTNDQATSSNQPQGSHLSEIVVSRSSSWLTAAVDNNILCGFNGPNDSYVYYCDQVRTRILLVRLTDAQLVANYKLPASLVSLKWADDGFVLVAGLNDGSLISLAIIDPNKTDSSSLRVSRS